MYCGTGCTFTNSFYRQQYRIVYGEHQAEISVLRKLRETCTNSAHLD